MGPHHPPGLAEPFQLSLEYMGWLNQCLQAGAYVSRIVTSPCLPWFDLNHGKKADHKEWIFLLQLSVQHQERMQLRTHCLPKLSCDLHVAPVGPLMRLRVWASGQVELPTLWLLSPSSGPKLGPHSFCLFCTRYIVIEQLLDAKNCSINERCQHPLLPGKYLLGFLIYKHIYFTKFQTHRKLKE